MARKSSKPIKPMDELPEVILDCIGPVDPKKPPRGPWRYGILATDTVVYTSGRLARAGDELRHDVNPAELKRCRALADKAYGLYLPPLASEGGFDWDPYFVIANRDEPIPERIDEALIRERFGGTILPVAPIAVSPVDEEGRWWEVISMNIGSCRDHVTRDLLKISLEEFMARSLAGGRALLDRGLTRYGYADGSGQTNEGDQLLREIIQVPEGERLYDSYTDAARQFMKVLNLERLFKGPDFRDAAFVEIGEEYARFDVDRSLWPPGLESWPSCFPRLIVGLTNGGSLAGVIGYVVAT